MNVTLYQMAHSPYCIPISQALLALAVPFETQEVPNWDRSEIIRLTQGAYYQVPLLTHGERVIQESSADSLDIAHYVEATFGAGRLFPEATAGLQAVLLRYIENEVEGVTFRLVDPKYLADLDDLVGRAMTIRHKERKFGRGCVEQWSRDRLALRVEADKLLAPLEHALRQAPFLFGAVPVFADFALLGIIGNLTYRGYNELTAEQWALTAWAERMSDFHYAPAQQAP